MRRCAPILALLVMLAGCRQEPSTADANALFVIAPYKHAGTWVFDDPGRGLRAEPFVAGVPEMIDRLVADIPDAESGFRLIFSAQEFPGSTHKFVWRRRASGGDWYYSPDFRAEGWLCPALLKYFSKAPRGIHVKAEAR